MTSQKNWIFSKSTSTSNLAALWRGQHNFSCVWLVCLRCGLKEVGLWLRLTNIIQVPSKKYVCQIKHSVFRKWSSAPCYLKLCQILLNQRNILHSRLQPDFLTRNNEPLHVTKLMPSYLPTVGSSCSKQSQWRLRQLKEKRRKIKRNWVMQFTI